MKVKMGKLEGYYVPIELCTTGRDMETNETFIDEFCGCGECSMDNANGCICETCTNQKIFNHLAYLTGQSTDESIKVEMVYDKLDDRYIPCYVPCDKSCGDCNKLNCANCKVQDIFNSYGRIINECMCGVCDKMLDCDSDGDFKNCSTNTKLLIDCHSVPIDEVREMDSKICKVDLDGKYFGLYDINRNTFVD